MITGKVVMVEVRERRIVTAANIDHGAQRISEIRGCWIPPDDRTTVKGDQKADSENVVFMSAAGMREDGMHAGPIATQTAASELMFVRRLSSLRHPPPVNVRVDFDCPPTRRTPRRSAVGSGAGSGCGCVTRQRGRGRRVRSCSRVAVAVGGQALSNQLCWHLQGTKQYTRRFLSLRFICRV
jgi:hypothetical protein